MPTFTHRFGRLPALLAAALLGAAGLAGCGAGTDDPPTGVSLWVTSAYGANELVSVDQPKLAGGDTVLRLLERNTTVTTKFGGGFISEIAGQGGGTDGVRSTDWFFFVNGLLSDRGASGWRLVNGEQIWWDLHRWDDVHVSVVAGQFPEPMRTGSGGHYRGAWLVCRGGDGGCTIARRRLADAGITVAAQPATAGRQHTKVYVGPWSELRGELPEIDALERGPKVSGVFAELAADGSVTALDADARAVDTPAGSGLIAVVRRAVGPPVWVVTGPDDAAVRRAARQLTRAGLQRRFAVLATRRGPQPLPASGDAG